MTFCNLVPFRFEWHIPRIITAKISSLLPQWIHPINCWHLKVTYFWLKLISLTVATVLQVVGSSQWMWQQAILKLLKRSVITSYQSEGTCWKLVVVMIILWIPEWCLQLNDLCCVFRHIGVQIPVKCKDNNSNCLMKWQCNLILEKTKIGYFVCTPTRLKTWWCHPLGTKIISPASCIISNGWQALL